MPSIKFVRFIYHSIKSIAKTEVIIGFDISKNPNVRVLSPPIIYSPATPTKVNTIILVLGLSSTTSSISPTADITIPMIRAAVLFDHKSKDKQALKTK